MRAMDRMLLAALVLGVWSLVVLVIVNGGFARAQALWEGTKSKQKAEETIEPVEKTIQKVEKAFDNDRKLFGRILDQKVIVEIIEQCEVTGSVESNGKDGYLYSSTIDC